MQRMPLSTEDHEQIKGWIKRGEAIFDGNSSELARHIGVSPQRISGWKNNKTRYEPPGIPLLKLIDLVLRHEKRSGHDVTDFLMNEDSRSVMASPQVMLIGHISGGKLTIANDGTVEGLELSDVWRESPWWNYTDKEQPVLLIRVQDDSMAPTYPDKSFIAVRKPSSQDLPSGTPCVFSDGADTTFKLLLRDDGGMYGLPLNRDFDLVNFRMPQVEYIALGSITPKLSASITVPPPRVRKNRTKS